MSTLWCDLLGAETSFHVVDGIRTRVICAGAGPALILLHGNSGHAEAFAKNIVPLSSTFRVIAVDYLGSGLTDYPGKKPTMRERADHIVGLMDALGVDTACVGGVSFGASVALACAKYHPKRFSKVMVIVGASFEDNDTEVALDVEAALKSLVGRHRAALASPSREKTRQHIAALLHDPERTISEELVDVRWHFAQRDPVRRAVSDMCDFSEEEERARLLGVPIEERDETSRPLSIAALEAISHPTLFLWSEHNSPISADAAREAATHVPISEFVLMKECRKWPQWERPDEFNDIVRKFAGSVAEPASRD